MPRTADAPESEGWVMGYVIDTTNETTALVIFDATTLRLNPSRAYTFRTVCRRVSMGTDSRTEVRAVGGRYAVSRHVLQSL